MNNKTLLSMYKKMQFFRIVEETIAARYHENKMRCPVHLAIGQEAISAAFSQVAQKGDYVMSSHRAHLHYLAKGGSLNSMISELYGKENGCSLGKGGSMHLIDLKVNFMGSTAIVGNSLPVGAGLALASKIEKSKKISCIYLGDACVEEGIFHETVNFCAQRNLPVLFICENNLYSVYSDISIRQPRSRSIAKMVKGMGIKSSTSDGNDVNKIYKRVYKDIQNIRSGKGPRFCEFMTYRWREHCGPNYDDHLNYRSKIENKFWFKKDPILKFEKELLNKKIISEKELKIINKKLNLIINNAFNFAKSSIFPGKKEMFNNVFAK